MSLNMTYDFKDLQGGRKFEKNPELEMFVDFEEFETSLRQLSNNLYQISSLIVTLLISLYLMSSSLKKQTHDFINVLT